METPVHDWSGLRGTTMKVLLIPELYPLSDTDSGGIFVQDQARILATRHDVTVLVPRLRTLRSSLQKQPTPAEIRYQAGVREVVVDIPNLSNRWEWATRRRWQSVLSAKALALFPKDAGPDIIHSHFVRPAGMVALKAANYYRTVAVLTEHSGPFSIHTRQGWRCQETAYVLQRMHRIAAVSPSLKEDMLSAFPNIHVDIMGNAVDETVFTPALGPKTGPFYFLFVGGLLPQKCVHDLLTAASLLHKMGARDWRLEIGGEGPLRAALEKQTHSLGLNKHVIFLGQLSRADVLGAIHRARALVISSKVETFGVVAIEAMACGVPVISTDCGGPPWVIGPDSGWIVPRANPDAMASALARMLTEHHQFNAKKIRESAVRRFGRSAWLDSCESFYRSARTPPTLDHSNTFNHPIATRSSAQSLTKQDEQHDWV